MLPRVRVDHSLTPLAAAIVQHGLRAAGCRIITGDDCDLLWTTAPAIGELKRADDAARRISHIAGSEALTNKARLAATMSQARRRGLLADPDCPLARSPRTFAMPEDFGDLKVAAAYDPRARWLRRPKVSSTTLRAEPLVDVGSAGVDPRWIVQEVADGVPVRVRALLSSIDPLTLDCWRPTTGRRLSPPLWASIELTIAAVVGSAAASMRAELAAMHLPAAPGFELLEFEFLVDRRGTAHLIDCAKWPHVKPATRVRDNPKADEASDAAVRAALERLGLVAASRTSRHLAQLLPSPDLQQLALIGAPTALDISAARAAEAGSTAERGRFRPQGVHHYFLDDALVLFSATSEKLSMLNPTGSFVWLRTAEGASPATVVQEAVALFHGDAAAVTQDVWSTLAGWIADGLLARREPTPMPAAAALASEPEYPRHNWNAGERVYEIAGRRICLRAPGGDVDRWLHATLDGYEQPAAVSYHDLVELLPVKDRFALLINGTRTDGPFNARDTPAAVHHRLRLLSLSARQCVLSMRATLARLPAPGAGSVLLLNAAADAEGALVRALRDASVHVEPRSRVLFCGDPLRLVSTDAPDATGPLARIIVVERAIAPETSALLPLRRAEALRLLMAEDADAISVLTSDGAARLVRLMQHVPCSRLLVADEREAAGCILRACASVSA